MLPVEHNISVGGRNRRLRGGLIVFALALALAVVSVQLGAPRPFRILLFVPFFGASVMVFQGLYKTCVVRATLGQRETNEGVERVCDQNKLRSHRQNALRLLERAALCAALATGLLYLLP